MEPIPYICVQDTPQSTAQLVAHLRMHLDVVSHGCQDVLTTALLLLLSKKD